MEQSKILEYFNGSVKHDAYPATVKLAEEMRTHYNRKTDSVLITRKRPGETKEIKVFREAIFESPTYGYCLKISNALKKIRKSPDWVLKFPETLNDDEFKKIKEDETLQRYLEEKLPQFGHIDNWAFEYLLKYIQTDANAVVAMLPDTWTPPQTGYIKPYALIFDCENVWEFKDMDVAILKPKTKTKRADGTVIELIYVYDLNSIQKWEQDIDGKYKLTGAYTHKFGELACWKVRGDISEEHSIDDAFVFESKLRGIVPSFNEAYSQHSDLQAEAVKHHYSERWEIASVDCVTCKATGIVRETKEGKITDVECKRCGGYGKLGRSPYGVHKIKMDKGQNTVPIPAGYIEKSSEIITIQDQRIDKFIFKGLASCNMEFLLETPLNQSGTAKEVDKDELNVFFNSIAYIVAYNKEKYIYFAAKMRYGTRLITNAEKLRMMLPVQVVPDKFDILNSTYLVDEIKGMRDAKVSSVLVDKAELDLAAKKFKNDSDVVIEMKLISQHNPFPGKTSDDVIMQTNSGLITKEDAILYANIAKFVKEALVKEKEFALMSFEKRQTILQGYATKVTANLSAAEKAKAQMEMQQSFN